MEWTWAPTAGLLAAILCAGCGDVPRTETDAGSDAGADLGRAAPPNFGACPAGWELAGEALRARCVPVLDESVGCGDATARFPSSPGCERIGVSCSAAEYPGALPTDRSVVYVRAGASDGDGTQAAPFGTIAAAIAAAPDRAAIAIARGHYRENLVLGRDLSLIGACADETVIEGAALGTEVIAALGPARLQDLLIEATGAVGLLVDNAVVEARSILIDGAALAGVVVTGSSAHLNAERLLVTRTQPAAGSLAMYGSAGLLLQSGAHATVRHAAFEENVFDGILVEGSHVVFEDVVVRRTVATVDGRGGHGLHLQSGASAEVVASLFDLNHEAGISVAVNSMLRMRHSIVRHTQPNVGRPVAIGVNVQDGATATIETSTLEANDYFAAHAEDVGTSVVLRDVLIAGTTADVEGAGLGLTVTHGARVTAERVALIANRNVGLVLWGRDTHLEASDLTVADTGPDPVYGDFGRGIEVTSGATFSVMRLLLERNREAGINVNRGSRATLADAIVRGTLARDCASTTCPESPLGMGVVVFERGVLSMERFEISENALAGAQLVDGEMQLRDGVVRAHPIGMNIQLPGVEIADVVQRVRFLDNERNLARDALDTPVAFVP